MPWFEYFTLKQGRALHRAETELIRDPLPHGRLHHLKL